jgi:uncharacterized protein (DUF58 family)
MPVAEHDNPARGAYTSLEALLGLRFASRNLSLQRRNRALSLLTGPNKSNFRGRGIDFEEVRRYQAGDDIRSIDWRVTARTGDAHTKLFREERERPVLLVTDQRNGMYFGSRYCFKSVLAAHVTALLGWSALDHGDRVGGLIFNDACHRDIRPRRSRRTLLHLLSELVGFNAALPLKPHPHYMPFADMLANLRRIARPGSSVFLVSDFAGATEPGAIEHLHQLARHTQLTAVHCEDPLEADLPRDGRYAVTDGVQRIDLHTGHAALRQAYRGRHDRRVADLGQSLRQLGVPLLRVATDQAPLAALQPYFGETGR